MSSDKKLIKITVIETGGEFTCGTIDDEDLAGSIKTKIEEENIQSYCELDDGKVFDAVMYDNYFHYYAPNVRNAEVIIEEAKVEKESDYENPENLEFNEIFNGLIGESGINLFCTGSQCPCPGDPEWEDDEPLLILTKKYEKRIHDTYLIKVENGESFNPEDIYIGFVQLEDVMDFVEDEILEHFLYIPKNNFKFHLKSALKNSDQEFDEDNLENDYDFGESIQEELWMDAETREVLPKKYKITSYSTEGKGEWENDYLQIINSEEEILYESGSY